MNKQLFILFFTLTFIFTLDAKETNLASSSNDKKETVVETPFNPLPSSQSTTLHQWSPAAPPSSFDPHSFDPSFNPEKPEEGDRFLKEFVNMLFTLGLILGLLLVASWFVKRFTNTRILKINESSNIKIIETRTLSARTTIYVLDIMGKVLTVAESNNGLTQLITPSKERIE